MSLLSKLKVDKGAQEQEERLSTGSRRPSDVYDFNIEMVYLTAADSGAIAANLVLKDDKGEYRETIYISNKNGENFYYKKDKDGNLTDEKILLPGYQLLNSIALLTVEKEFDELESEEKVVRLYDFEERKELPKTVEHLPELVGQPIKVAIIDILENKNAKNDATNKYEATAETREINQIEFVAHQESGATVTELRQDKEPGSLMAAWLERNKGKQKDKRKIKDGAPAAGKSGRPTPAGASGGEKKTSSLFKK